MSAASKERPIIFSSDSVRAILGGTKTQTRRVIKPQPDSGEKIWWRGDPSWVVGDATFAKFRSIVCPYGVPGDRLWVRETWATGKSLDESSALVIGLKCKGAGYTRVGAPIWYVDGSHRPWGDCDLQDFNGIGRNRNALFMPRWASRITLKVTEVRVQWVQKIGAEDCIAEGLSSTLRENDAVCDLREQYQAIWNSLNAKRGYSWESNPWAWAVTFEVTK